MAQFKDEAKDNEEIETKGGKNARSKMNRGKGKGRGSNNARRSKPGNRDKGQSFKGSNDPKWYVYNDQIVSDAGMVSYNNRVGVPLKTNTQYPWGEEKTQLPTLMAFHWTPTLGPMYEPEERGDSSAPINIQCRAMLSKIQSSVSATLPFNAADLAIHWGAIDSLFIYYKFCQRLYQMWQNYQVMNTQVPEAYFMACGLDFSTMDMYVDTTQASGYGTYTMVDFRADLNRIAVDLSRLFVPRDLKIFERHKHMTSNIYADAMTQKHQEYMFVPAGVWKFEPNVDAHGGRLTWRAIFGHGHITDVFANTGLKGVMDIMKELMSVFYNDSDVWTIDGYIRRAYKDYDTYKVSILTEFERIDPIYDVEMLLQIHHLDAVGFLRDEDGKRPYYVQTSLDNVRVDHGGWHQFVTEANRNGHVHGPDFLLDMPIDNPTPLDNLVATRLMVKGDMKIFEGETTGNTALVTYGSEIINNTTVITNVPNGYFSWSTTNLAAGATARSTKTFSFVDILGMCRIAKFAFHPMWKVTNDKDSGSAADYQYTTWTDVMSDTNNATTIDWKLLRKMHDASVMGEWFIPKDIPLDNVKR